MPKQTPSMTVGPFFAYGLAPAPYGRPAPVHNTLVADNRAGNRIRIHGIVRDVHDQPVNDALIEIWQADAVGRYVRRRNKSGFFGFGRCATDDNGVFFFDTVKPGPLTKEQAPHINVIVLARGLLNHMFTRIYFDDENDVNRGDRVLQSAGARKKTLLARRDAGGEASYEWNIKMRGRNETVFFDL